MAAGEVIMAGVVAAGDAGRPTGVTFGYVK
jgi:hypothetical protein